jgi:hypothetical protein
MDLDQAGAGTEQVGRNEAFGQGTTGTPWTVASSLNQESSVLNAKVAGTAYSPQSVLQPMMKNPGGNGMSAKDAENRTMTGDYYGNDNGSSESTFKTSSMMKLLNGGSMV